MTDIPDPPAGSSVRKEPCPEEVRLSWPGHSPARGTMLTVAFALAGVAVVVGVGLAATLFRKGTPYEGVRHFVVAGFLIAASFLATLLAFRLRSLFRESIVLGPDALSWFPPASASEMSGHFGWGGGGTAYGHSGHVARGIFHTALEVVVLWRERESIRVPRAGITDLRLEGRGRFEHLTISVGKAGIDVAKRVSHDDRVWLLELLRRWRDAPG